MRPTRYSAGEAPGKGTYKCPVCGWAIVIEDDAKKLPRCPKCNFNQFEKVA